MPNLSFTRIAATLATLTACTKQAPAPDTIQRTTDLAPTSAPSAAAAPPSVVAQPPAATATATAAAAAPTVGAKDASVTEHRAKAGSIGSAGGQMSCGAGTCSGSPKKK